MNEQDWKAKRRQFWENLRQDPGVNIEVPDEEWKQFIEKEINQQWLKELNYRNRAWKGMKFLTLEDMESCVVYVLHKHPTVNYEYIPYPNGARKYVFLLDEDELGYIFLNPKGEEGYQWDIGYGLRPESELFLDKIQEKIREAAVFALRINNTAVPIPNNRELSPEEIDYRNELLNIIKQHFDDEELQALYFELGLTYRRFTSGGTYAQAQALVEFCFRHDRVTGLTKALRSSHPNIDLSVPPSG